MTYDVTERVAEVRSYFDDMLDKRIAQISEIAGVGRGHFVPINPADFIEKNKYQTIHGYTYKNIAKWISEKKKDNETYLVSPLDEIRETAAQVSYKSGTEIERVLRASRCKVVPVPIPTAQDFFIRNHRQSPPLVRETAVCYGLAAGDELVAVMLYDISNGAVRGKSKQYELVRLAIAKGTRIHGGASKLEKACETTLAMMGIKEIYSYSNATINSGAVYEKLGFTPAGIDRGQPFVILNNNKLERLINLYPISTDKELARHGWILTHVGGNRRWRKNIQEWAGNDKNTMEAKN